MNQGSVSHSLNLPGLRVPVGVLRTLALPPDTVTGRWSVVQNFELLEYYRGEKN